MFKLYNDGVVYEIDEYIVPVKLMNTLFELKGTDNLIIDKPTCI